MSKKHPIVKSIFAATTAIYATNKIIDMRAKGKYMCSDQTGRYYSWKEGEIYYTKKGQGSPILLIHNLDAISSSQEWKKISYKLAENHTVYTLDLLGCGQSEKPSLTYTNYLYVQLIKDFINDIIGEKTNIVASADASSFVAMANHIDPELFHKVIMINPPDLKRMKLETTKMQMYIKNILFLPLIGKSLYNYYMSEKHIKNRIMKEYFYNSFLEADQYIATCYQTAHMNESNGRFLYASKRCHYTNIDMTIGLSDKFNLFIIASDNRRKSKRIIDNYQKTNPLITIYNISNSKLLPQLESPKACYSIINAILE